MTSPQPHRDPRTRRLTVLPPLAAPRTLPAAAWQAVRASVQQWAVDSQRAACRNAMVAGTALAARRAEREDVEEFFAVREARAAASASEADAGRSARG